MLERVLIAGAGGQGVIMLGKALARLAVDVAAHVTFFPSYGAEVRGGTSNCQVIFSSHEIASPLAEEFDSLIIMNQQSLTRFLPTLAPKGLAVINQSLSQAPRAQGRVLIRATEMAYQMGSVRVANFIMLGAWLAHKPLLVAKAVEGFIAKSFAGQPDLVKINIQALRKGMQHI